MDCIETARLRLRPLAPADVPALHGLWITPAVRRYLWDDVVIPRARTASIVDESVALFETQGFGLWGVFPREEETLIGFCGFWFFHDPPERQLLYGLADDSWGRGLATEAARAMLRYGFETLGFDRITGSTDAPNTASRRVMEKAGMTFEKRLLQDGLDTIYYTLTRADFEPDDAPYHVRRA